MLQAFGLYLAVTGGAAAGAQAARGAVRGVARLVRGDVPGALAEAAGGLIAPVVTAAQQFSHLGADVYKAATSLTAEVRRKAVLPAVPPLRRGAAPRRRRAPTMAASGVA